MNFPNEDLQELLQALQAQIPNALENNLEGIYVKGSLALGDFNSETSDVDLLVVTKRDVSEMQFARLDALHRQIQSLPNRYRNDLEVAYIPAAFLNNFVPGQLHASIERGEQLKRKLLGSNWILDFWIVREHGWVLFGPNPKTFIDPIDSAQMRQAVREVMPLWLEWVATPHDPGWYTWMGTLRFAVETMCRAMYTFETGQMCSKPVAVRWALVNLPETWQILIQESQGWWLQPVDKQWLEPVWALIRWVAMQTKSV